MAYCAPYLNKAITNYRKTFSGILRTIKNSKLEFDAIAVKGVSGQIFGPAIATILNKEFIIVRGNEKASHSFRDLETNINSFKYYERKVFKYIIIDDLIENGGTIKRIKDVINNHFGGNYNNNNPKVLLVGVILYSPHLSHSNKYDSKIAGCKVFDICSRPDNRIELLNLYLKS